MTTFEEQQQNFHMEGRRQEQEYLHFSQWIHCMCIVTFDLNLGQALEFVYPPASVPTEQEISNICYMAFPDSNSGCMGDTKFHMRFRMSTDATVNRQQVSYNRECTATLRTDQSHFWGFVYFRQKRDVTLPRGYFQKSFILISRLPFFNLFYEVLEQLALKYFDEGNSVLVKACQQIEAQWPELCAGESLNLPLFERLYQIQIPKASSRKLNTEKSDSQNSREVSSSLQQTGAALQIKQLGSVNELELFHSLEFVIENLYTLWELVITAEPVVVVGTSPADCSHMVQTLVALIAPLEYFAESRPYFTIHDSEFKEFTRECGKTPPAVILGVTNPFFIKLLKDWPHIIRLVDNQTNAQLQISPRSERNMNSVTAIGSYSSAAISSRKTTSSLNSAKSSSSFMNNDGSTAGLQSKYKPFLRKDKNLIKKILAGVKMKRPEHVQTALIRRHLLELTQSFMIPLERYMASLMPLQKDISPFKSAPNANAFKLNDFLNTLEISGPHLTSPVKGDWKGLYKRFFNSPNFRGWYESRNRELQLTLLDLQLQALSETNLEQWARDKQEVEIIDMILKLKQKLSICTEKFISETGLLSNGNGNATKEQILAQIDCMKQLLPQDLRNVVNL